MSSGGIAALDMMHSLIVQHHGPKFARRVSDWFVHTEVRSEDLPYRSHITERFGTRHSMVIRAMEVMEGHIAEPLNLESLAALVGVGPRQTIVCSSRNSTKAPWHFTVICGWSRQKSGRTFSHVPHSNRACNWLLQVLRISHVVFVIDINNSPISFRQ